MSNETVKANNLEITPDLREILQELQDDADKYLDLILYLNDLVVFKTRVYHPNDTVDTAADGMERLMYLIPLRELILTLKNNQ